MDNSQRKMWAFCGPFIGILVAGVLLIIMVTQSDDPVTHPDVVTSTEVDAGTGDLPDIAIMSDPKAVNALKPLNFEPPCLFGAGAVTNPPEAETLTDTK